VWGGMGRRRRVKIRRIKRIRIYLVIRSINIRLRGLKIVL